MDWDYLDKMYALILKTRKVIIVKQLYLKGGPKSKSHNLMILTEDNTCYPFNELSFDNPIKGTNIFLWEKYNRQKDIRHPETFSKIIYGKKGTSLGGWRLATLNERISLFTLLDKTIC